jgi:hypothetical protein
LTHYSHETFTDITPDALFAAITAIDRWPEWGDDLERTEAPASLSPGASFLLRPKGGPNVRMTVVEATRPRCFTDRAHLFLGTMTTTHLFERAKDGTGQKGTRVTVEISVRGPLGFFWDRIIARKQAAEMPKATQAFLAFAERQP